MRLKTGSTLPFVIVAIAFLATACGASDGPGGASQGQAVESVEAEAEVDDPTVVDLTDGLVAHFPLDGDAQDVVGSTHGQVVGAEPGPDRRGESNMALRVREGTFIEFADAGALNVSQDFTIGIWIEPGNDTGTGDDWYTLFEKSDPERGGHSRYGLWLHGDRPAACFEVADNSQQPCVEATEPLPHDGGWHHVAAVRSGRRLILYVDGAEVANGFVGLYEVSQTDFNAFVGSDRYQPDAPWLDAAIDDLRVYNRGLTPTEITAIAQR